MRDAVEAASVDAMLLRAEAAAREAIQTAAGLLLVGRLRLARDRSARMTVLMPTGQLVGQDPPTAADAEWWRGRGDNG